MREEIAWLCVWIDAFARADEAWMLRHVPAGLRYHASDRFPEGSTVYTGGEGMVELMGFISGTFGRIHFEEPTVTDHGDVILLETRVNAASAASGVPLVGRPAQLWRFEGGQPVSVQSYVDRDEALAALRERPSS